MDDIPLIVQDGKFNADGQPRALPVLFLVDADAQARERIATALTRRFGADYEVRTAGTESEGLAMLEQLGNDGARVALIAADLALTGDEGGITFLERAHMSHPHASRVLLVAMDRHGTRIPFDSLAALKRATALNRIDFWVVKGASRPRNGCTFESRRRSARGPGSMVPITRCCASSAITGRPAAMSCARR